MGIGYFRFWLSFMSLEEILENFPAESFCRCNVYVHVNDSLLLLVYTTWLVFCWSIKKIGKSFSYKPAHVLHQSMVAHRLVVDAKQIVERRLRRTVGIGITAQSCKILCRNPPENGANFGKLVRCGFDEVVHKITQRLITQICRSLKRSVEQSSWLH